MSTKALKLSGLSVRIACLVHLIELYSKYGERCIKMEPKISAETFSKAWKISEFFLSHHNVLEKSYSTNQNLLNSLYEWLSSLGRDKFTRRDLQRLSPLRKIYDNKKLTKAKKEKQIKKVLEKAEDFYWIKKEATGSLWTVNPQLLKE